MAVRIPSRGPLGQKAGKAPKRPAKGLSRSAPMPRAQKPIKARSKAKPVAAQRHIEAVKLLPCAICGAPGPSDAHHAICDRHSQRRAPDSFCIPLCKSHHQVGPEAIHQNKTEWVDRWGPDWAFLPRVYEALGKPIPEEVTAFIKERTDALHQ